MPRSQKPWGALTEEEQEARASDLATRLPQGFTVAEIKRYLDQSQAVQELEGEKRYWDRTAQDAQENLAFTQEALVQARRSLETIQSEIEAAAAARKAQET